MNIILKDYARQLRKDSSDAENYLWHRLRNNNLQGYKFRRQYPIPPYIVDFICIKRKLIIELDGGQHMDQTSYDNKRAIFLHSKGYKILRFWNVEIFTETENVINAILNALTPTLSRE